MQKSIKATVELKWEATLGEGPVWDEAEAKLYWVDILSGTLFQYDPDEKTNPACDIGEHLGAVALREQGGLVMAMQSGFAFFDPKTQKMTKITDPESHLPDNRFNDGKCDPSGRFWAGTLSYNVEQGAGSLYCLDGEHKVDLKLQDLTISNGMAWNKERSKFFFIDTPSRKICAYDYDDTSGEISNPSVVKKLDKSEGYPDGMTIDQEGRLWVALYDGGKVIRIDPANGETLFEVYLPVPQVTSCTFGGPDFNELYITTGRENMPKEKVEQVPLSGSLFKVELPYKGSPASRFLG
jgi:sugar lactone lactonase YvrE